MYPAAAGIFLGIVGAVAQNLCMIDRIALGFTGISGIALDGIYDALTCPFHDSNMIRVSVLAVIEPVEEDNVSRLRDIAGCLPESTLPEPLDTAGAGGESGQDSGIQIAALIGTPAYKAGAPLHMAFKAIPAPIEFSAHIADLGQGNGYNVCVAVCAIDGGIP